MTEAGAGRWPLARVFAIGTAAAAVILVAVIATGGFALWRLTEVRAVAAQVGAPGLLEGQRLEIALVNEETGVRGFAATGRPESRVPYDNGLRSERESVAALRAIAPRGITDFTPAVDALQQAVEAWRTDYADPTLAGRQPAPSADLGQARFDQVRIELAKLIEYLTEQRAVMAERTNAAVDFLIGTAVAIAVLLIAFMVLTWMGLRRAVLRPISQLADQVRDLASGNVHQQVQAVGPREIVELGARVDAMRVRILRDLDEAQETNRQLDEQAQDLERSNRDLEQFAYVASHDLQEPLRKVSSFCQLLQRRYGGQLDERADQYIAFAVDGALRMQQLINDLLSFSRVGRSTDAFERVELSAVAAKAAAQLDSARAEVDGTIEIGELPTVCGDPGLLQQLLVNLLGNGLKFHRADIAPQVRVHAKREGADWRIEVVDNGIGIEPEYADKVFVIFQRLHPRDSYAGTGIGLALAKKIVEFHGGRIAMASSDEPGTTIRFTLPVPDEET